MYLVSILWDTFQAKICASYLSYARNNDSLLGYMVQDLFLLVG